MTQAELAAKLNYTDKAVSKWERGEAMPDIETLRALAELFDVSVDDLLNMRKKRKKPARRLWMIPLLSCGIAWLVATIVFVMLKMFAPTIEKTWLAFIYAVPVSAIIVLVFACIWRHGLFQLLSESLLVWSVAAAIFLSFPVYAGKEFIFLLPLPLEALAVLWFVFRFRRKK